MKLLHLANGNLYGGIERLLVTLARLESTFPELQHRFLLSHEGRLSTELRELGAQMTIVPGARLRRPLAIGRARRTCRRVVQESAADVAVAHGPWAYYVFGHGLRTGVPPVVFWQHGAGDGHLLHRLAGLRRPTGVIANSEFTAETTHRIFPGMTARVVRTPVLEPRPRRSRASVRAELGAHDRIVVLQTSRFEEWKGHRLLLMALAKLSHLPWELWLAGGQTRPLEVRLRSDLERLLRAHRLESRVKFLGERQDVPEILAAADIFCQPNTGREPFGLGPLEAIASGLPVVATDLGATALGSGRSWARVVEPSPEAIAEALSELLSNPELRKRLGEGGRSFFRENFRTDRLLQEIRSVLYDLVETSPRSRTC